jgi:D-xylose transport system substrate-binding protein
MRGSLPLLIVIVLGGAVLTAAAPARTTTPSAKLQACALLPGTQSSAGSALFAGPYLTRAFKTVGVRAHVLNAHNDPQKQKAQAEQCLARGAKVIVLDQLSAGSGAAITNAAVSRGAKVVDYDRLVVGSKASLYISFDTFVVGKLQAQGLIAGLKAKGTYSQHPVIAELNGGITDDNAHLLKQGYDSILNPLYKNGTLRKATAGDQWTDWDPMTAQTSFELMLARNNNEIDGVLAANDALAGAVVATLKNHGLKPIPLTGQDATPTGIQYILAGWQTGTVYKSVKLEAATAANAAIAFLEHTKVRTNAKISGTPSILLVPKWITRANYKLVFKDGFVKKSQVCVGAYKQFCR